MVWLCQNDVHKLSGPALDAINEHDLLISPVVLVELNYLLQNKILIRPPHDIVRQLKTQIGLGICAHSFPDIAETAVFETWTRDPFDLLIVSNAKANGYAPLITKDEKIRANYQRAVW